jgi:hypothetical protein
MSVSPVINGSSVLPDISGLSNEVMSLLRQCGAMQRPHSGRTLLDHLVGTHELLRAWGNSSSVCLGGLFHSIYGTNAFRHESLSERDRPLLRGVIGYEAESLAWDFCHVDRPAAIIAAIHQGRDHSAANPASMLGSVVGPDWISLAEIEVANLLEQGSHSPALRQLFFLGIEKLGVLSSGAQAALKNTLSAQLRMNTKPPVLIPSTVLICGGRDE